MKPSKRYPELDAFRGLAIIAMMAYHLCFNLSYFFGIALPVPLEVWKPFSRPIAFMFLTLVGLVSTISWQRSSGKLRIQKLFKRFELIALGALLISVVTYIVIPGFYVRFGILHLIATAVVLQPLFQRFKVWNLLLAAAWYIVGMYVVIEIFGLGQPVSMWTPLLLPLGVMYPGFSTLDYYPLIPWFAVILFGIGVGYWLYPKNAKGYLRSVSWPKWLLWMGRYSLFLYLIHQPILYGVLWMIL